LPGTALYDDAESFKLNYLKNAPYTLISSPGFPESDMSAAESLKNACNIFYNQGGAAGWMFMVLETLDINPSEFLETFAEFIITENITPELSGDEIPDIQLSFVKEQFSGNNLKNLYPVMADLILFHGAVNSSLYAGPYSGTVSNSFNDKSVFKLSPGTRFLTLGYNFDELMTVGELTLEEFLSNYRPEKTYVIIYNCGGEVRPLIVDKKLTELLQSFTGKLSLHEVLKKNSSIDNNEVHEFIEYALAETMIFKI